jgi:hypothetical protein
VPRSNAAAAIWDRDYAETVAAAKALGFTDIPPLLQVPMLHLQPDKQELKRFRKACGCHD